MSNLPYIIRNYRPEDFDMLIQLVGEVGKGGWSSVSVSPQDVIESLGRPNHFPEKDLFVAEKGGNIIGYVDITEELNIGRVVLSCVVHPVYRGNGVATKLIERAVDRARELKVKRIHVNIPEESATARELFMVWSADLTTNDPRVTPNTQPFLEIDSAGVVGVDVLVQRERLGVRGSAKAFVLAPFYEDKWVDVVYWGPQFGIEAFFEI